MRASLHRIKRQALDDWFGTLARYVGLGMLVYAVAINHLHDPALLPTATGLIFFKNVRGG